MVANGEKITRIEDGIVPFDIPAAAAAAAAHVAVFKKHAECPTRCRSPSKSRMLHCP